MLFKDSSNLALTAPLIVPPGITYLSPALEKACLIKMALSKLLNTLLLLLKKPVIISLASLLPAVSLFLFMISISLPLPTCRNFDMTVIVYSIISGKCSFLGVNFPLFSFWESNPFILNYLVLKPCTFQII
ncbi:hypothetical protein Mcup_1142 [Metallosphaera cuprina Ar-4]|uniref:Uncharacterized protein n=1 Tax=Metallosphaera cuprina (strain Ar-4) TaxID=1006006 RepID=F4G349_METCR|nr:hypothetical protein Mcup_1142 [Metallosphaera cuprina Ar-4]